MSETLSDQEVICGFMEPRPELPKSKKGLVAIPNRWWKFRTLGTFSGSFGCGARVDAGAILEMCDPFCVLGYLHAVEERLTDEQWREYEWQLICVPFDGVVNSMSRVYLHATAEQKIKALAAVLRKEEPQ